MAIQKTALIIGMLALAACGREQGVGLGEVGAGGNGGTQAPDSVAISMTGLAPLPSVSATVDADDVNAKTAAGVGGSALAVNVGGVEYAMRQVTLNGTNFVIAKGGPASDALAREARRRTGCLTGAVANVGSSVVYTLDCS